MKKEKHVQNADDTNNLITFRDKTTGGDKLFLSMNLYVNDFEKHYNILTLGNLTLQVNNNGFRLIKGSSFKVRVINDG